MVRLLLPAVPGQGVLKLLPLLLPLPSIVQSLLSHFSGCFTRPSYLRFIELTLAAILTPGRRSVTRMLLHLRHLRRGHPSSYHRFFSRARWSLWKLGKVLAILVLATIPAHLPVLISLDDTSFAHRGAKVYAKARHRDAVRSTRTHTVWHYGHRWVVLCVCIKLPFRSRPWALPILMALYRSQDLNTAEKRRHRTPSQLGRQLLAVLIHWFPDRRFIVMADSEFSNHNLSAFCHRHRRQLTLVSRFFANAALYEAPPKYPGKGRPRVRGARLPSPQQVVAGRKRLRHLTVTWYGGKSRRVGYVTGTGMWYKAREGLTPVRWVYVKDLQGNHRAEYFYSTDRDLSVQQIIEYYVARWPIETTFQEAREHLGVHTPRQRSAKSVLRMTPLLLGLYSLVCLLYAEHVRRHPARAICRSWYNKAEPTFSDALATVRRLIWRETIFMTAPRKVGWNKLPPAWQEFLLDCLCPAA